MITMRDQGSDDTKDSDADPTTGATASIMLKRATTSSNGMQACSSRLRSRGKVRFGG